MFNEPEPTPQPEEDPTPTLARIVIANLPKEKILSTLPGPALYPTVKELTDGVYGEGPKGDS